MGLPRLATARPRPSAAWWSHRHPNVRQEPAPTASGTTGAVRGAVSLTRRLHELLSFGSNSPLWQSAAPEGMHIKAEGTPPSSNIVCLRRGWRAKPFCLPQHGTFMHEPCLIKESACEDCTSSNKNKLNNECETGLAIRQPSSGLHWARMHEPQRWHRECQHCMTSTTCVQREERLLELPPEVRLRQSICQGSIKDQRWAEIAQSLSAFQYSGAWLEKHLAECPSRGTNLQRRQCEASALIGMKPHRLGGRSMSAGSTNRHEASSPWQEHACLARELGGHVHEGNATEQIPGANDRGQQTQELTTEEEP